MELVEEAIISNNFGLKKKFPWSGSTPCDPWTQDVYEHSEKEFVKRTMGSLWNSYSKVKRVENSYLWAAYVLRHKELEALEEHPCQEKIVIHATFSGNADRIAVTNFNWRLARRCRFGQGVSFAKDSSYAKRYASGTSCYIIAGICYRRSISGGYNTIIPPIPFDTTVDGRGNVYVKYYDSDFYPYYIVK